jgi:hypothetical protein
MSHHHVVIFESLELGLLCVALVWAILIPRFGSGFFGAWERRLRKLARKEKLAAILVGFLAFSTSAATSIFIQWPQPRVQDEFSYLLGADTFVHGRLSNLPHSMWQHFESYHIIQQPTYASKYPPAQGAFLALGKVTSGQPIVGVWISAGMACGSICWMLQAWFSPGWALLGGFLSILRLGFLGFSFPGAHFGYFSHSYWGGAVAAMSGALILGAARRIAKQPRLRYFVILGCGLVILANSRPFEGLVLSIPIAVWLAFWCFRECKTNATPSIRKFVLPLLAVLSVGAGITLYYNYRVTFHPLVLPYQVHEKTYAIMPNVLWTKPNPEPTYRHWVMKSFYGSLLQYYWIQKSWNGLLLMTLFKLNMLRRYYLGFLLMVPLLMLPWALRRSEMKILFSLLFFVLIGVLSETWVYPHYVAPVTGLVIAVVLGSMRHLRAFRFRGKPVGRALSRSIVIFSLALVAYPIVTNMGVSPASWSLWRAQAIKELEQTSDQHLILVRYQSNHNTHIEWVYNEADIDNSKVVWAREMDQDSNLKLFQYFNKRKLWLLEVDKAPLTLRPLVVEK